MGDSLTQTWIHLLPFSNRWLGSSLHHTAVDQQDPLPSTISSFAFMSVILFFPGAYSIWHHLFQEVVLSTFAWQQGLKCLLQFFCSTVLTFLSMHCKCAWCWASLHIVISDKWSSGPLSKLHQVKLTAVPCWLVSTRHQHSYILHIYTHWSHFILLWSRTSLAYISQMMSIRLAL